MQVRRAYLVFFALVAAVAAAGVWIARSRRVQGDALSAVPSDAWLVASIDVGGARGSALAQALLGAATTIPGIGSLSEACGFDPVTRVGTVAVCAPEGGERGDFGVSFTGDFTRDELARCLERVMRAKGAPPVASSRGAFVVLEGPGEGPRTRFAYRDGGPFLVGRGAWLDAMIDAASGRRPELHAEHAELRAALSRRGGPPPALLLTASLPAAVRQRLRGELGPELGSEGERAFAGVLAVRAAGVAVGTGGPGSTTDVAVELRCETADACAEVRSLIERKRLAASRDLGLRLLGIGPLIDSLSVEAQSDRISASAHAPTDDLARILQRLVQPRPPARFPAAADAAL